MALAWALLFGAPAAAGALAARRRYGPDDPGRPSAVSAWQAFAAGLVSNGVGALTATALGTGTTALMLKSAWVRDWLYHGQHLTASAVYGRELYASQDVAFYAVICVAFPIIGSIMGTLGSGMARMTGPPANDDGPPGPPGHGPVPAPSNDGRLAGTGAD